MKVFKDQFDITGNFVLKTYDGSGNLIEEYEERNLIVNGGRESTMKLIGGAGTDKNIDRIAFGSNGSDPAELDSAITEQFAKPVAAISYPAINSVQFDFTLELNENNGATIREFGLLSVDGTLFARKTRAAIVKDNTVRLEGTWTLVF